MKTAICWLAGGDDEDGGLYDNHDVDDETDGEEEEDEEWPEEGEEYDDDEHQHNKLKNPSWNASLKPKWRMNSTSWTTKTLWLECRLVSSTGRWRLCRKQEAAQISGDA